MQLEAERIAGVYRAIVKDNDDPEGLLRVRVIIPSLTGAAVTDWAWPSLSSTAGATAPALEDPVWVTFEDGDIDRPVYMGTWSALPPPASGTPYVVSGGDNDYPSAAATFFASKVAGDTYYRFRVLADGTHQWGPGNTTYDTALYRSGPAAMAATGFFTTSLGITATTGNITANSGDLRTMGVGGTPRLYMKSTDQATDQKAWDFVPFGADFKFRTINDAGNAVYDWLVATRSGNSISTVTLNPRTIFSNGVDVGGGSIDGYHGQLRFTGNLGNGTIHGITTNVTGNSTLYFDHRGTGNLGAWVFRNGTAAGTWRFVVGSDGGLAANGTNHYFGPYAISGGTGSRARLVAGGGNDVYLQAEASSGDANLLLKWSGNGALYFQKGNGVTAGWIDNLGTLSLGESISSTFNLQLQANQARLMVKGDQNGVAGYDSAGNIRYLIGLRSDVTGNTATPVLYAYANPWAAWQGLDLPNGDLRIGAINNTYSQIQLMHAGYNTLFFRNYQGAFYLYHGGPGNPTTYAEVNGLWHFINPPQNEVWAAVGFQNGWLDYVGGFERARYCIDSEGFVHVHGLIQGGTVGAVIFNLPVGYRPRATQIFACDSSTGHARVDIGSNGNVTIISGGNSYLSLSGITFPTI